MLSLLVSSCYTQQPQQGVQIDWSNQIAQALAFAFVHGALAFGFCVNGQSNIPYAGATPVATAAGIGAKSNSSTSRAYQIIGNHGLTTTNYSLFAVATASAGVTQNAIDMDNGGPRYFQFRLSGNKVDFIPFNTSAAVTGQPVMPNSLTTAELMCGVRMGATASATRTAAFQNGQIATATPTNLIAPTTALPVGIGARASGTAGGWTTGGLAMVLGWSRTLADAEMLSLCANPWQLWKLPSRRLWYATTSASDATGSLAATLDGATFVATGQIIAQGAFASTMSGAAFTASGTVGNAPSGTIASTLAGASMAATGNVTNAGAFASTLGGASMAASGAATNRGALASTLDGATLAASGAVNANASGSFASTLDGATFAAGGYVGTPPAAPDFFIRLPKNPRHSLRH